MSLPDAKDKLLKAWDKARPYIVIAAEAIYSRVRTSEFWIGFALGVSGCLL